MANVAKQNNVTIEVVVGSEKQDGSQQAVGSGCSVVLIKVLPFSSGLRRHRKSGVNWNACMLVVVIYCRV
jgi:hypothetical protein